MAGGGTAPSAVFRVDSSSHWLGALLDHCPAMLKRMGRLESRALGERMGDVQAPIYIAGLARAGSTLLLEILSRHPQVATHRYRDFPLLHVPFLWNRFLELSGSAGPGAAERAHGDGIVIDRESPEAFEEVLWMSYFPHLHDPERSSVLDASTSYPEFEAFYRDHIRKLLLLRQGSRYVSKGNYNVTRLGYIRRIFPGARIVVPVRDPASHVASLLNQQIRFLSGERADPRALTHLRRSGHFEFGSGRRAIHTGDAGAVGRVLELWQAGREVEGWARYWSLVYDHVIAKLDADPDLAASTLVLPFETVCRDPAGTVEVLLEHCGLDPAPSLVDWTRQHVRRPSTSASLLEPGERNLVEQVTRDTIAGLNAHLHVIGATEAST